MQNAIRLGKVSHAYIFSGEDRLREKKLATAFAMTLQCEQRGVDPCLTCSSCKKAMSKNHPDIINITHEKPNSIGIEDIRSQLIDDVAIKPYCSSYKIYIISEAEKLTLQAQNALLKTIEEPPAYAVILLLTNNMDALLPTITSPMCEAGAAAGKRKYGKGVSYGKTSYTGLSGEDGCVSCPGKYRKGKTAGPIGGFCPGRRENALRLLRRSGDMELYELVDAIKMLSADKQNIYDYLDLFTLWFRDVLLFKATREVDGLVFKDQFQRY